MARVGFKLGKRADLPDILEDGVFYICTDTRDTFVGADAGSVQLSSLVSSETALAIKVLTASEYDALGSYDEDTLYIIKE